MFTGTGNFSNPARWTDGTLPLAGDYLIIEGACTVDDNVITDNVAYGTLVIGLTTARSLVWATGGTNRLNVTDVSSSFAGSTLNMTNGGTLVIRGTWTPTNLTFTAGTGTIDVRSTLALPTAYTTYYNLTVNGAGTTVTTAANTSVNNNLTVTSGIFSVGAFSLAVTGTTSISSTMTITSATGTKSFGDLLINSGGTFSNTTANEAISIAGNLQNNGTFNEGTGLVTFTGATSNTISGTASGTAGTTAFGGGITVNKGVANTNVLDVQSVITLAAGKLTLTNGTFKLSSASTITPFTADIPATPFRIPSTAGLWVNAGTVSTTSSVSFAGLVRVSNGILNIGDAADENLLSSNGAVLTIDGGAANIAGRFSYVAAGDVITYNMSAGTLTAGFFGSTNGTIAPFDINQASTSFNMSGGTIIIRRAGNPGANNLGYNNAATGGTGFIGGTLQIGDASTPVTQIVSISAARPVYNLTVNSANATARLAAALTVSNNVLITAGLFTANNLGLKVGGGWTNNAAATAFTGGIATVTMNGTIAQSIAGSFSTTFNNLTIASGNTVTSNVNCSVTSNLLVSSGTFDLGSFTINRLSAGGTLTVSNGAILKIGGTNTFPSNYSTHSLGGISTVEYNGTTQTVTAETYGNLILSNSGVKSISGSTITVAEDFTMSGSVSVTPVNTSAGVLSISGTLALNSSGVLDLKNYTLSGTLTSITGTGAIKTQCTATLPLLAGRTWTGPIEYNNATGGQNVVGGTYINLTNSNTSGTNTASGNIIFSGTLTVNSGSSLDLSTYTLKINGNVTNNGGSINATNGTVECAGSAAQTIPAGLFSSTIVKSLLISNAAGVTLGGALKVTSSLGFGNVNNSIFNTAGFLTLGSTSSLTAKVADITNGGVNSGNNITGAVTVERFFTPRRAYRFLTAPVTSIGTIKENWMENAMNPTTNTMVDPVPGYGINITGTGGNANGFDVTATSNPSLFTFNTASQSWVSAANTNGLLTPGSAYRVIVRGSRSTDMRSNSPAPTPTTIRTKGPLSTGTIVMTKAGDGGTAGTPDLSPVLNSYSYIGNPYASTVDWGSVTKTDISSSMYLFDPTVNGSNGRGAWVSYNLSSNSSSNSSSAMDNNIQPGQGFLVLTTGPNPSLTFKETNKTTAERFVFRTNPLPSIHVHLLLPGQELSGEAADGTSAYFSKDFSNSICEDDSYKFTNQDENIAIVRNGMSLSQEGRKPVNGVDSLPLKLWQLSGKEYTLKVTVSNFDDNVEGYLEDKYLNVTTPLPNGETLVPFSITTDAASSAVNRFRIVFESFATLPVRITGIKAYEKNKGVQVDWVCESESNVDVYEVEKSADAIHFTTISSAKAKNNPALSTVYAGFDNNPIIGDNFYRIKTVEKSGSTSESEILKVNIASGKSAVSVTSNFMTGNSIKLLFNNAEKGTYAVSVIDAGGRMVYTTTIVYNGGAVYEQLTLNNKLPAGVYQLQLVTGTIVKNIQMLVQ